jgi:hypothetical protein
MYVKVPASFLVKLLALSVIGINNDVFLNRLRLFVDCSIRCAFKIWLGVQMVTHCSLKYYMKEKKNQSFGNYPGPIGAKLSS